MGLMSDLKERHMDGDAPFLIQRGTQLRFQDVLAEEPLRCSDLRPGDVVALVGDFDRRSISVLIQLLDLGVILAPLTRATRQQHAHFFDAAHVDLVIENDSFARLRQTQSRHPMLEALRSRGHAGLVLFSSGTTGRPKAILHDSDVLLRRYRTLRPTLRTLTFLLFDHIGGINTLFHTLFNKGSLVVPSSRIPESVLHDIANFAVELLPTTPTFLRMMLMSGALDRGVPESLKLITYGAERMDADTLTELCNLLPTIDFRQTYGMSELGILRVKSRARDSLWMMVGGEGIEAKVVDGVLKIRAKQRMIGYLNAASPFDSEGWFDTKDVVQQDGDWIRVVGRNSQAISVGGVKFLPSEVERVAMQHSDVLFARAEGVDNPITGQHVELVVELKQGATATRTEIRTYLEESLPDYMRPHRIKCGEISIGHRFKQQ